MNKREAKKELLGMLLNELTFSDDLFPEDLDTDNPRQYRPWDKARNELAAEFSRRLKHTR